MQESNETPIFVKELIDKSLNKLNDITVNLDITQMVDELDDSFIKVRFLRHRLSQVNIVSNPRSEIYPSVEKEAKEVINAFKSAGGSIVAK